MTTMSKPPSPTGPTSNAPTSDAVKPIGEKGSRSSATRSPLGRDDTAKVPRHDDPTRYGDWEIGGRCIDF